jgi:hypothetical protein
MKPAAEVYSRPAFSIGGYNLYGRVTDVRIHHYCLAGLWIGVGVQRVWPILQNKQPVRRKDRLLIVLGVTGEGRFAD